jgi:uncharacterized Zn finger protein (UPF0148 family)
MLDRSCERCFTPLVRGPGTAGEVLCMRCDPPNGSVVQRPNGTHAMRGETEESMRMVDGDDLESEAGHEGVEAHTVRRLDEDCTTSTDRG